MANYQFGKPLPIPSTCGGTGLNLHTTSLLLRITDNQTGVTVDDFASVFLVIEISMISTFAICSPRDWTGLSSMAFPRLEFPNMIATQLLTAVLLPFVTVVKDRQSALEDPVATIVTAVKLV